MARKVKDATLDTRESRLRLRPRGRPYWRSIGLGLHIGYRRLRDRAGTWTVRHYLGDRNYALEAIGPADDGQQDADGVTVLSWWQAVEAARGHMVTKAAGPYTVDRACDDYLAFLASDGRSEAAVQDARYRIDAFIRPQLGKLAVAALDPGQLRSWRAGLAKARPRLRTGRGKAQKHRDSADERARKATANRILTVLKAALNHAFDEQKVPSNLAWSRRVKAFENVTAARVRFLSVAESQRLINASEPSFRLIVTAALMTGMRYGELSRLAVGDFDCDAGIVTVRVAKGAKKPRHVVLTEEGVAFFASLCAGRAGDETMLRRDNGEPWARWCQHPLMAEACERAGIKPRIGFHGLRHTWASLSVMSGMPLMVVAKNLGHADTVMVQRHYAHLASDYITDEIRSKAPRFGVRASTTVAAIR